MKYRKYIFAIVFMKDKKDEKTNFLILHRIKNWQGWEILKGGIREKESELECLRREIKEETGTKKFKIVAKTKFRIKYKWPRAYVKDHKKFHGANGRLFLIQLFDKKVRVDREEHDKFKWVEAEEALKYLTYLNEKNALKYILRNYDL